MADEETARGRVCGTEITERADQRRVREKGTTDRLPIDAVEGIFAVKRDDAMFRVGSIFSTEIVDDLLCAPLLEAELGACEDAAEFHQVMLHDEGAGNSQEHFANGNWANAALRLAQA
jgi:hypothetical protein